MGAILWQCMVNIYKNWVEVITNIIAFISFNCVVREKDLWSTGCGFESRPPLCRMQACASCLHACASVTSQWAVTCRGSSVAGEVTAGLAESNGSLPPGLWLPSPAGWLPSTGISSGTLRSLQVWYYIYLYLTGCKFHPPCGLFSSRGSSQYIISVRGNQTDILSQLIKCYIFSVSISAFVCFYSVAERELTFDDLRRKTDQEPIVKQIKRRKWSWLGHNDNIAKQTTVDTARSRNTRRRDLESEMGSAGFKYSWRMMEVAAQDWTGWRKVVCGQCCTGNSKSSVKWRTCTELTSIASTLASQRTVNANE